VTNTGIRLLRPVETAMVLMTPPAGATEREFLTNLLANADESYAERGWDQPYQLLAVAPLISLTKKSRDRLSERARATGIPFEAATAVIVAEVPVQGDGALIELIGGCRVPEWVRTLVLTSESWVAPASSGEEMDPTASLRPSAHPGRVEARTTIAVAADGYTLHLMTVRDGAGQLSVGDAAVHPCGRTTDLLLRLMGAPTAPSAYYPGHLVTAVMLKALPQWAIDTEHEIGTPGVRALAQALAEAGGANGALYYPRLREAAEHDDIRLRAPSGSVAGVYARTDRSRGVWSPPAGAGGLRLGRDGPAAELKEPELLALQAAGVNGIRTLPGGATVLWGDRTLQGADPSGPEWKYVGVRRLYVYLEHSLDSGLQWTVFEPNDEPLWASVRLAVGAFMNDLWGAGALQGRRPSEAYFVRCDQSTMSQGDLDNGHLRVVAGFAPLKPGEFVVLELTKQVAQVAT